MLLCAGKRTVFIRRPFQCGVYLKPFNYAAVMYHYVTYETVLFSQIFFFLPKMAMVSISLLKLIG